METIATYSEVRFDGSRTFALYSDKLVIKGKQSLQSDFETSISLKTLDPNPDILRFRNQNFNGGMWITIVAFVICSVLARGFHLSFASYPVGLVGCIGMSGFMLMLATYQKVEFVRFKNDGGIVILDIAKAGKDANQLDAFITALKKQISLSRGPA